MTLIPARWRAKTMMETPVMDLLLVKSNPREPLLKELLPALNKLPTLNPPASGVFFVSTRNEAF